MDLEARHTEFFLGIVRIEGGEFADAGQAAVSGNRLAVLTKDFHHLLGEPHSEFLTDIDKGNRIEVFLHLDDNRDGLWPRATHLSRKPKTAKPLNAFSL